MRGDDPPRTVVVSSQDVTAETHGDNTFRREGEYWTIEYGNSAIRLRDTKGLQYVAHLLAHPGRDVHVADLCAVRIQHDEAAATHSRTTVEGDLGALLDPRATAEYKRRLADLREELDEATSTGDIGRAERIREELEAITHELSAAYGLGGRARKSSDANERVRKAVTNQIRRALEKIRSEHPSLGRHLTNAVHTGVICAYRPEQPVEWHT